MLQNAYFLAKIGADTAENEQHFAEIGVGKQYASQARRRSAAPMSGSADSMSSPCTSGCASAALCARSQRIDLSVS